MFFFVFWCIAALISLLPKYCNIDAMRELLGALFKLRWRETIVIVFSTLGDCFFVFWLVELGKFVELFSRPKSIAFWN